MNTSLTLLRMTANEGIANEDTALLWKKTIDLLASLQANDGKGIAFEKEKAVDWGKTRFR